MTGASSKPVAFEVALNGRALCRAGLAGRPGVISAILTRVDRGDVQELEFHVGALDSTSREHMAFARRKLRVGDEVAIRVVENPKTTRVRSRTTMEGKSDEKLQKTWLRETAKTYGYKLVKADDRRKPRSGRKSGPGRPV